MLLALPLVITSCDDHEHLDTALHIGHVVCSDGQTLSVEECERLHKEPVAVVFSVSAHSANAVSGTFTNCPVLVFTQVTATVLSKVVCCGSCVTSVPFWMSHARMVCRSSFVTAILCCYIDVCLDVLLLNGYDVAESGVTIVGRSVLVCNRPR